MVFLLLFLLFMDFSMERLDDDFFRFDHDPSQENSLFCSFFRKSGDEDLEILPQFPEDEPPTQLSAYSPICDCFPFNSLDNGFLLPCSKLSKSLSVDHDVVSQGSIPCFFSKEKSAESIRLFIPSSERLSNEMEIENDPFSLQPIDYSIAVEPLPMYEQPGLQNCHESCNSLSDGDLYIPTKEEEETDEHFEMKE